jgi:hypothetical protein
LRISPVYFVLCIRLLVSQDKTRQDKTRQGNTRQGSTSSWSFVSSCPILSYVIWCMFPCFRHCCLSCLTSCLTARDKTRQRYEKDKTNKDMKRQGETRHDQTRRYIAFCLSLVSLLVVISLSCLCVCLAFVSFVLALSLCLAFVFSLPCHCLVIVIDFHCL